MQFRTRIKMCGTTCLEDAEVAVSLGVDALGFILVKKSPRYIYPEIAADITKKIEPFVAKIGVFVNTGLSDVAEIADQLGLTGVQLHGDEDPEYCQRLADILPSCAIVKAFRVGEHSLPSDFKPYTNVVSGYLLDTFVEDKAGGTGLSFNWRLIEGLDLQKPYILAGGLHPENIDQALLTTIPYGVDVNSGVESAPGKKNHDLLRRFITQVAASDYRRSKTNAPQ